MLRVLAGVALASIAWGAAWLLLPRTPAPADDCGGVCGPGTACAAGQCLPAAAPEPEPAAPPQKGKKGKKGRRSGAAAGDPADPADPEAPPDQPPPPFVPVDDSKIPAFSDSEPQVLDLKAGSERLEQRTLDQHFARVTPEIQGCVTTASRYGEVGSGSLAFKLRILPSGKVEGVNVAAPTSLRVWGIPPCARKAVYQHRFPAFDGPAMAVSFSVDID
ncbi:MAG: hypothetical protein JNL82_05585 [Myxococcales bacterium]|nr:hypothetical protein [Myxococcales bacterium]